VTLRLGWYVHHHGRGHLTRLLALAPHVDAEIACLSTLPRPAALPENCMWTQLPRDDDRIPGTRDPQTADPTAGGMLHWAPLGHVGHRARMATIADELAARDVDACVVDVSVEVTLLARLLGVTPILIAQPGRRDDDVHRLGFAAAETIVAPWPGDLLRPAHLAPYADKVVYTGGISRFAERTPAPRVPVEEASSSRSPGDVLLITGGGGSGIEAPEVVAAATATGREWRTLGGIGGTWHDDPWTALTTADTVVSWAGQNSIAALAAADAAAVIVPQERPFAEQRETAGVLEAAGLAVVSASWPEADRWPDLLDRAAALTPRWERWQVAGAAQRAAAAIHRSARAAR